MLRKRPCLYKKSQDIATYAGLSRLELNSLYIFTLRARPRTRPAGLLTNCSMLDSAGQSVHNITGIVPIPFRLEVMAGASLIYPYIIHTVLWHFVTSSAIVYAYKSVNRYVS